MKRIISTGIIIVLALVAVMWYRKTDDSKPLGKLLIVGTSADYPPFSFRGQDDEITGFDIDIIKEVARRLSLELDIQDKPFNTLIAQMQLGQIHVVAAGMTPTEERTKQVRFTKPYLSSNPLLIVTRSGTPKISDLAGLKGKQVIVNAGYTADLYLSSLPDITLLRLPRVADALTALEQGKADAFVTASFTLLPYVKEGDKRFSHAKLTETDEQSALAISKQLPEKFLTDVQKVLDDMEADGTLTALKNKWKLV